MMEKFSKRKYPSNFEWFREMVIFRWNRSWYGNTDQHHGKM